MPNSRQAVHFDRRLIQKYDRPGPRYTSYPTAPQFSADFQAEDYRALLERSRANPLPLSLYVHVPFCETRCFFCGCNVIVSHNREKGERYLGLLEKEMERVAGPLGAAGRQAVQVHWGGGTPTFLPPEHLAALAASLRRHFPFSPRVEFSVEVDPRRCDEEQLDALVGGGVNRLSMGIQDLDPKVQAAVNRVQSAEEIWKVIDGARKRGVGSVNVDLIYGLPHQTVETFRRTVAEVIAMAPDRLAVFNFAYLPKMFRHQGVIDEASLPDPEVKLTLLEETITALVDAGYLFLGMDHFARPDDSLARALADGTLARNFQGYSVGAREGGGEMDLVALGVSSIGKIADGYAQNWKEMSDYREAIDAGRFATSRGLVLDREDHLRRDVINQIMCHFELDKGAIEAAHGILFDEHFADELEGLEPLAEDGLVEITAGGFRVTPTGRLLVRNVAMCFDEYLKPGGAKAAVAGAAQHSRTI